MIDINFVDWQHASTEKENDLIRFRRDCFKSKLKTFETIKNRTGSIAFSNNNEDKTKFSFVVGKNNSSQTDKFWSKFLDDNFSDEMGG